MEIISLFEVVKLGKSATQVGKQPKGGLYPVSLFLPIVPLQMIKILFLLLFFSLSLMTGLRHIKMIVTLPFWTWLISLFSALAVKVRNGTGKSGSTNDNKYFCFTAAAWFVIQVLWVPRCSDKCRTPKSSVKWQKSLMRWWSFTSFYNKSQYKSPFYMAGILDEAWNQFDYID